MKKIISLIVCGFLLSGFLEAAPKKPSGNAVKNLQKGSVINGSKATGDLKRWMFFNDGSIGGSWTKIGRSEYISVDLGYSATITTIATAGGLRGIFGIDFEFPIYVSAKGQSNTLTDHKSFSEVLGWGAMIPLSVGIDVNGFYLRGLVGYGYNEIKEGYDIGANQNASLNARYHGLIYGGSIGYRIKNIINIGAKAMFGKMKNDKRDADASLASIREPKDRHYDMMRFGGYISIIF
ncbi:autotransporter outer membrane beta-barrel domain-containing protein [Helicobacter kayseriensis]|uniref:autotransporter outer membrane beta-barrel domain-containing protein n=1 Tax=Helicobacter kayseriensis TaxID=2905877 RepID=UPI001E51A180|nr:autotransporter outer membrane beta-barrel domain-containing protein [Helicobacter kayseriensis]MCE3047499.1 autotransporter outer membrane beta-barrel domain-containing protein [Helicobacter kayseriensis]MCE3048768.1 autotransporter outer membrane beta-barrel domain-containing protein [Helicobacter kayseriensis]